MTTSDSNQGVPTKSELPPKSISDGCESQGGYNSKNGVHHSSWECETNLCSWYVACKTFIFPPL